MPDYSKSVIYCISCKDESIKDSYVGSSADFEKRKKDHKDRCNNPNHHGYNYKVYQFIREHGGFDNFEMKIIEYYPCENETELNIRENYWMDILQTTLNSRKAPVFKNIKEWREANIEHIREYDRIIYKKNKDANKEKRKEFYQKNKEKISEKLKEKMTCECGRTIRKSDKYRHYKTKFHINFINNL